ncbi:MAG: SufD family Fe-S cluster assembly protein [Bacteroidaceae bacterium]|nr:SufD family Fe-S cluster assembly protein [Bacteroidaceae bacterium]
MEKLIKDLGSGAGIYDYGDDTLEIRVPAGVKLAKPVYLTQLLGENDLLENKQNIIIFLMPGSEADVVITDRTVTDRPFQIFRRIVSEANEATLQLYVLQEQGAQTIWENQFTFNNNGHVTLGIFCMGSGNVTNCVRTYFHTPEATADIFGMTIASGTQQVTNAVTVTHRAPRCRDRELFKQILDGEAVGRFEGLVQVNPQCPGADSQQTSRSICLSRTARAYAQPQLIIDTDDVRCSHGATVGQLDEEALFYMQQRGIPRHEARLLLLSAFLDETIDRVTIDGLRERLRVIADTRLRGDLDHCVACGVCKNNEQIVSNA